MHEEPMPTEESFGLEVLKEEYVNGGGAGVKWASMSLCPSTSQVICFRQEPSPSESRSFFSYRRATVIPSGTQHKAQDLAALVVSFAPS